MKYQLTDHVVKRFQERFGDQYDCKDDHTIASDAINLILSKYAKVIKFGELVYNRHNKPYNVIYLRYDTIEFVGAYHKELDLVRVMTCYDKSTYNSEKKKEVFTKTKTYAMVNRTRLRYDHGNAFYSASLNTEREKYKTRLKLKHKIEQLKLQEINVNSL